MSGYLCISTWSLISSKHCMKYKKMYFNWLPKSPPFPSALPPPPKKKKKKKKEKKSDQNQKNKKINNNIKTTTGTKRSLPPGLSCFQEILSSCSSLAAAWGRPCASTLSLPWPPSSDSMWASWCPPQWPPRAGSSLSLLGCSSILLWWTS